MGATPEETTREISEIRFETEKIVNELGRRVRSATDMQIQARQHPRIVMGLVAIGSFILASVGYRIFKRMTTKVSTMERFEAGIAEPIRFRAQNLRKHVRSQKEDGHIAKRVIWVGLASTSAAIASIMARRALAAGWRRILREEPPG